MLAKHTPECILSGSPSECYILDARAACILSHTLAKHQPLLSPYFSGAATLTGERCCWKDASTNGGWRGRQSSGARQLTVLHPKPPRLLLCLLLPAPNAQLPQNSGHRAGALARDKHQPSTLCIYNI